MKLRFLVACGISACAATGPVFSAEAFTNEQRQAIAELLAAERVRVVTEVDRELNAKGVELDTATVLKRASDAAAIDVAKQNAVATDSRTDEANSTAALDPLGSSLGVLPPNRGARDNASVVQIDTSDKGTEATLSVGTPKVIDFKGGRYRQTHWNVTASAPLSDEGYGTFADLNGLTNGFGVKAEWTRTSVPFDENKPVDINAICTAVLGPDHLDQCSVDLKESKLTTEQRIALGRALKPNSQTPKTATVSSFGFGLDHDEFKYLTLPNEKQTDSKIGWNVSGSYGVVTASRSHYWGGGFTYAHGYKPVDPSVVCTPNGEPTFTCVNARFAPPKDMISRILYAEMRSSAFEKPYSVRISHDLASDQSAVDVPIYLIAAKDKGFTGGLRFGWQTEEKFIAGIFVGAAFDVWP